MFGEKPKGWKLVQQLLPQIIELGVSEGIIQSQKEKREILRTFNITSLLKADEVQNERRGGMNLPTDDISLLHSAIPFLPVPAAIICFILNFFIPGMGTILSGYLAMCLGQTRVNYREGQKMMTFLINGVVGISQFFTTTFLLVGWFWSIAWGGIIFIYSVQYRDALRRRRKEDITMAALEALTRDSILHRRDVKTLVQEQDDTGKDHQK